MLIGGRYRWNPLPDALSEQSVALYTSQLIANLDAVLSTWKSHYYKPEVIVGE